MRSIRRLGALAIAGLLLSAVASGTAAGAATTATYTGAASGYALKLSGGGQTFTAGASDASAASTGTSKATGTGDTVVSGTVVTASNPPGETKAEECAAALPPAPLDALPLSLGLGCGSASATGSGLTTTATATGKVASLNLDLQTVITQIPVPTGTVTQPATDALKQLCDALAAIPAAQIPTACQALTGTVQQLLDSVTSTKTLASEIGSSTSGVTVAGNNVTSESTGQAAVIKVLPTPVIAGVPLPDAFATITVSRANAKVVCDLSSGNATPAFDPAIVRVKLAGPIVTLLSQVNVPNPVPVITIPGNPLINGELAPVLSLQNGEFTVTPGTTVVLFPGLPIETEIAVGSGTAKVNADKSASASADGVKIHAVRGTGTPIDGGLLLNLAHAEAAGACVAATGDTAAPTTPTLETPRELPRTGGTPWLPIAGVAALAAAVVTRRALVRSH